jgi:hypothetical protein
VSRLDIIRSRAVAVRKNPLRAARNLGRDLMNLVVFALAGKPPEIWVIVMSAAVGFLVDRLPARATGVIPLRLD